MTAPATAQCRYIFGIVEVGRPLPSAVAGVPLRHTCAGTVAAVHRDIDPEAVAAAVAEPGGQSLADLARIHDKVLRHVARLGPVLPVRFGTLCAEDVALEETLRRSEHQLAEALAAVRGRGEWTVRIEACPANELGRDSSRGRSGTQYLLARRQEQQARRDTRTNREGAISRLEAHLDRLAERSQSLRCTNAFAARAYLVEHLRATDFATALVAARTELDRAGLCLRIEGPLPPYSFADVRLEVTS